MHVAAFCVLEFISSPSPKGGLGLLSDMAKALILDVRKPFKLKLGYLKHALKGEEKKKRQRCLSCGSTYAGILGSSDPACNMPRLESTKHH